LASPTVYLDQRFLLHPEYETSYDLTVGKIPTFDLAKDKLKIAGTAVTTTAAELNILDTVTATAAELNYVDIATLGTGAASKAVVLDTGDDYTWPSAGILTYGVLNDGTTALNATALELNAVADDSARLINAGATLTVSVATHGNRIVLLDTAGGSVVTLPAATGTGATFTFIISTVATSASHIVKVTTTDTMVGHCNFVDDTSDNVVGFKASGSDDTITLNRTTTGLTSLGSRIVCVDYASALWAVHVDDDCSGTPATPFSATVS